jgi:hypothetical protein
MTGYDPVTPLAQRLAEETKGMDNREAWQAIRRAVFAELPHEMRGIALQAAWAWRRHGMRKPRDFRWDARSLIAKN